jgi:hypothetical protein
VCQDLFVIGIFASNGNLRHVSVASPDPVTALLELPTSCLEDLSNEKTQLGFTMK